MRRIIYGAVVAAACTSGTVKDYYPMAVDNSWRYEVQNLTPWSGDDSRTILDTLEVTVTASVPSPVAGRTAFRVVEDGLAPLWWIPATAWIEPSPDSVVVSDSAGTGPATVLLLLPPETGTSWDFEAAGDTIRATVARLEEVKVNGGTFAGCVRVDYASPRSSTWRYAVWFAPGVGPVRYDYRNGLGSSDSTVHRWALIDYAVGGR